MRKEKTRFDYRHILCIAITLGFVAIAIFCFPYAFKRLLESGQDFGLSVAFYFVKVFGINSDISPTVSKLSSMPITLPFNLASTFDGFKENWAAYWTIWASKENLIGYIVFLGNFIVVLVEVLVFVIPIAILAYLFVKSSLNKENNYYNQDSKPLIVFKKLSRKVYTPAKVWVKGFFEFVKLRKYYWIVWLLIWAYAFNLISVLLEAVAFFIYFAVSLDFLNIFVQVYKLV